MDAWIVNQSFVFIVGVSNPSLYTSNYLSEIGVIPGGATIDGAVTVPVVSQISFNAGYRFEASENRVALYKEYQDVEDGSPVPSRDITSLHLTSSLQDAAQNLIPALTPLLLDSVGINFRFFLENVSLDAASTLLPNGNVPFGFQFFTPIEHFRANYTLTAVTTTGLGALPVMDGLLVDVNFDCQLEDKSNFSVRAEEITHHVGQQQDYFRMAKGTLSELRL